MRYLSMYGIDGFRTFRGILNGRLLYAPEKIPKIDPEILTEHDYSLRLREVISPYIDNHPKFKDVSAIIPQDIGTITEINPHYAIWRPKNHLSLLGEHLLAALLQEFMPEELEKPLQYFADYYDSGFGFADAFSLEKKHIFIPDYFSESMPIPQLDQNTKITRIIQQEKDWMRSAQQYSDDLSVRCDHLNIVRILGHMATIVEALYQSEKIHFRFYNDPVSLALPADDIEFLLAGFYLTRSNLPIKKIYAVSSHHRMMHNFLEKGEFIVQGTMPRVSYINSLFRMLFEASRGSVEKIVRWKNELNQGSFKIDSSTLSHLQKVFIPVFTTKNLCDDKVQEEFSFDQKDFVTTKLNLAMYSISKNSSGLILAFDRQNPSLISSSQEIPTSDRII